MINRFCTRIINHVQVLCYCSWDVIGLLVFVIREVLNSELWGCICSHSCEKWEDLFNMKWANLYSGDEFHKLVNTNDLHSWKWWKNVNSLCGVNLRVENDNPYASKVWKLWVAPFDSRDQAAKATQGGTRSMAVIEPCVGPLGWRPVIDILFFLELCMCV